MIGEIIPEILVIDPGSFLDKKSRTHSEKWIFCPEMTLAQFPEIGFFVQNSRIAVKGEVNQGSRFSKSHIMH